jgi:hypothetical protein
MISKLPEILGKYFIVGYFVPSLLFVLYAIGITKILALSFNNFNFSLIKVDLISSSISISLLAFFIGVILLSINKEIIRIFEGYGKLNPFQLLIRFEVYKYKKAIQELDKLNENFKFYKSQNKNVPLTVIQKRNNLLIKLAKRFPDDERWLLPTSFGNIIRSFETYPRVMYGIDSIPSWNRLLAVIPSEYLNFIEEAKTKVDLWINCLVLSIILIGLHLLIFLIFNTNNIILIISTTILLVISWIAYEGAIYCAIEWGDFIKSSFDLFLLDLLEKLGYSNLKGNLTLQKEICQTLSQAYIYRHAKSLLDIESKL